MACFHVISISLISSGDLPCALYVLWILPVCALLLCSMTHYDTTMGHDIVRDIHCDTTMDNDVAMCT